MQWYVNEEAWLFNATMNYTRSGSRTLEYLCMQLWRWDWTGSKQDINGETLNPGANISASARGWMFMQVVLGKTKFCFFMAGFVIQTRHRMKISSPNKFSKDTREWEETYVWQKNDGDWATIPLVFITTGGMPEGCLRNYSRLAELIAIKKGETHGIQYRGLCEQKSHFHSIYPPFYV